MPVEGREKGVRSPYEVRFGITHPSYLGVNTQKSALALTDAEGVEGINLRVKGGRPISRGGQQKVNVAAVQPIHGFTDTTSDAGLNGSADADLNTDLGTPYNAMYVIGNIADSFEGSFVHIDRASAVVVSTPPDDAAVPSALPIRYNGVYVGAIAHDETDAEIVTVPGLVSLFELPHVGSQANCTSLLALGSDLLAAWLDTGAGVKVSLWDGSNLTQDLLVVGGGGGDFYTFYAATLCEFQGTAYLGMATASAVVGLYRRLAGSGSWTSIAYPGETNFRVHHMLSYRSRLYIIGDDSGSFVIYSTDGLTLVKERTIGSALGAHAVAQFAIVRDVLYYWYHDGGTGAVFNHIGKFDGASWNDTEKSLAQDVPAYTRGFGFVGGHDGADVVYADDSGNIHVWESDGINIFGTWTKVLTNAAGVYGVGSTTPPVRLGPAVS